MTRFSSSRRSFLQQINVAAAALTLDRLAWANPGTTPGTDVDRAVPNYRDWTDIYRLGWTWDHVAKGTHHVNCWYQRGCTFNVFVKDGLVLREEQAATYEQIDPSVPDFNPRGCQKGACYSDRMYDASRLLHPLKRMGKRGEGKWKRVSWDEALTDVADGVIDVLNTDGPGAIYWDQGGGSTSGGGHVGLSRTDRLLDTIRLDIDSEVGDHHPGANVTCGKMMFTSSADDCFYSDLILIWGGNPATTQIPNAHFIHEARYNGAHIVVITPDLNASAMHADQWVPVNVGTDAALGLSLSQVIIEENLFDATFIREQTDLPLLVRTDTRRFLRGSDLDTEGGDDRFYVHDLTSGTLQPAPTLTLAWNDVQPALDGEFTVETSDGPVTATPVFSLLRQQIEQYAPEAAQAITGTHPEIVRSLARRIANAKSATVLTQSNFAKFYHGMEMERVQFLVFALCGQFGKKGSGVNAFPLMPLDGPGAATFAPASQPDFQGRDDTDDLPLWDRAKRDGQTAEQAFFDMTRAAYKGGNYISSALLFHHHGGMSEIMGNAKQWDPHLKRDAEAHLAEAYEQGWQLPPPAAPKVLFEVGGNVLRRVRGDRLIDGLLPDLPLLVTVDWRLSTTALYSDYVFPAAGWYERNDVIWATPLAPYAQATTKAVDPLGDAKPDWEFHCLLLKKIQERAVTRGLESYEDRSGQPRSLARVYEEFTFNRRYAEKDEEALLSAVMKANSNTKGTTWETLKQEGHARFTSLGPTLAMATDIKPDETITACTWHTEHKMPWPTLTRRMQFYVDHDLFFELGEELPVHKDNPPIGGDYPLQMTGGHARWSIHSSWRDHDLMLRLQQGEPVMYVSLEDARARDLDDGDRVRVSNDVGAFEVLVKTSPSIRPGQTVVYDAWEPFQFPQRNSYQSVQATPMNPIQMVGGYSHLQPRGAVGQPGMNDRGVRVEIEKLEKS
ncbi:MAG: molybdopterin-dependent oxidoreductase [Kiritimatiellia bacterium]|jgi:DMSO reductase family type II enzyme molybdopterin subunit|nr:molybdopterin-dependent oxidoreductase [Pseudomonadales bacterium]MDP6473255.1 molybdopterin-dependent oxidoreductase [Pseudomonadales bacterium]MDP6829180.1 molybdopterin-dependent oxidoreductase [Pseudomonadales bacterium]MDP7023155.1 molybdopterin-dependent oxidoreductase [Kiritimatiellia bacterium]